MRVNEIGIRVGKALRLQDGPEVPELCRGGAVGGGGDIPGGTVRGHQSVRDSCQEGHDHAQGYPASEEDTWTEDVVTVDVHAAKDLLSSGHRYLEVR
ncbi:hypothetical protein RJ639_030696 [Escallonia herrerae]|uniref:Uncharacterized protein n=1 Tax=Escallonia herrerae TaxID=1293975 RepID=A0AA88X1F1_9ASTE|nr:hypothetical protein RJ639_030696 [Escallonia herrerae]